MKQLRLCGLTDLIFRACCRKEKRWSNFGLPWPMNRSAHSAWRVIGWLVADENRHMIGFSLRGTTPILPMWAIAVFLMFRVGASQVDDWWSHSECAYHIKPIYDLSLRGTIERSKTVWFPQSSCAWITSINSQFKQCGRSMIDRLNHRNHVL